MLNLEAGESLAKAMVDLLTDEERLSGLKRGVRDRAVEELSWQKAGERFKAIYNEILRP